MPKTKKVKEAIKQERMVFGYYICREDNPRFRQLVMVRESVANSEDGLVASAENSVRRYNQQYGTRHTFEIVEPDESDYDGLRGTPARLEAERRILAGPDTPGRRFLLELQTGKAPVMLKTLPAKIDKNIRKTEVLGELLKGT